MADEKLPDPTVRFVKTDPVVNSIIQRWFTLAGREHEAHPVLKDLVGSAINPHSVWQLEKTAFDHLVSQLDFANRARERLNEKVYLLEVYIEACEGLLIPYVDQFLYKVIEAQDQRMSINTPTFPTERVRLVS